MNLRLDYYTVAAIIFILSIIATIYLTSVFITTLLLSVFFVYLLEPVYLYLLQFTKNRQVSSFLTILMAASAILCLMLFVADQLLAEVSSLIGTNGTTHLQTSNLSAAITSSIASVFPTSIVSLLGGVPSSVVSSVVTVLQSNISAFVSNTPIYITQLILLVFFTYYFFTDGKDSVVRFIEITPKKDITYHFLKELNLIYNVFFRVQFVIAIVSAIIAMVGFFFIGIPYPITWGIILGFFALLPELGPATLFVPMALYFIIAHDFAKALEVFVFGEIFLVLISEYILRPRLVSMGASVHPVYTILAFTAPIFIVGASGIIVGPVIFGFALAGYRTILYLRKTRDLLV